VFVHSFTEFVNGGYRTATSTGVIPSESALGGFVDTILVQSKH
jgi:hypothetical protein